MFPSSSNPLTYVSSAIWGRKYQSLFADVRRYVMFIGQPRSGTSLLGSLLNAHRHMLISQELNALKYLRNGYRRSQLLWLIYQNEKTFAARGRQWTGYEYNVPTQWQGRWEVLRVIGDKKAGKSTEELTRHPHLLSRLERLIGVPVSILHIVRNPFNVITTIHRKVKGTSLTSAADMYFSRCATNWRLMQERPEQIWTLRLEDFIRDPRAHLRSICEWLDVTADEGYLEDCAGIVFAKPHQSRFDIMWPTELIESVRDRMSVFPFLGGYQFNEPAVYRRAA
jgi:hypothetical protein